MPWSCSCARARPGAHDDDDDSPGVGEVSRRRPRLRAFYEYHRSCIEPWDGPRGLAYTDGRFAGASVDRNGLRPCRYKIRHDGLVVVGSEVGLVDLEPEEIIETGKVGPGEVLVADLVRGQVIRNLDAKREVAGRHPYETWVRRYMSVLGPDPIRTLPAPAGDELVVRQRLFGYGFEDLRLVLEPMARRAWTQCGAWVTTRRSPRSPAPRRACTPTSGSGSPR